MTPAIRQCHPQRQQRPKKRTVLANKMTVSNVSIFVGHYRLLSAVQFQIAKVKYQKRMEQLTACVRSKLS
ncbi:hypothetical protein [Candidatus Nitrotoga sp. M5]|uniref:hypothetical protein n=1 Tax=Candidatus Nitrotoga sp. M5 TaxID=2890409 RepID=UPI001EF74672|nr:hypothetical protein [Candidatus Nitrotoga sp. M5]